MLALIQPRPSWTPSFLGRRAEVIPSRKEESTSRTSSFNGLAPWPSHNASNLLIIGEAEPVIDNQRHVETSRKSDGLFTVEKGMVRYRGSQQGVDLGGNGHYPPTPSTFGLWEMLKMRRPQKWEALSKLLPTQSTTEREPAIEPTTTSTIAFSWNTEETENESHHQLENHDSLILTEINSRTEETSTVLPITTTGTTTGSEEQPDTTTITNRDASPPEDSGSIPTTPKPVVAHQLKSSWLVVRVDESTCYAVTDSFANNGTIVFKRFQTSGANQSGWNDLSDIEAYYPGFSQVAVTKPAQLTILTTIVVNVDETLSEQREYTTAQPDHADSMGEQLTVLIVATTSSPVGNETIAFDSSQNDSVAVVDNEEDIKLETTNTVAHHLQSLNTGFRKVDDDESAVNSIEPKLENEEEDPLVAMNLAISAVVNNVTAVPTSSDEEQMTPPLLKTLEQLLLTHLLPQISSSSSISSPMSSFPTNFNVTSPSTSTSTVGTVYNFTSASPLTSTSTSTTSNTSAPTSTTTESYFSWLLHQSAPLEPIQSINDWTFASQLIEPARISSTDPASLSTTVLPEQIIQAPTHYDPAINAGTLSSHSMIISARSPSSSQPVSPPYPLRKPISERIVTSNGFSLTAVTDSQKPLTNAFPIQMFTVKPEIEAPKIVTNKPASKKNTGLASLILAHTSALMSGKNSPFFNSHQRSSNSSDSRQTKRNSLPEPAPVTASVHVIVASPFPDPEQEEQLRRRSLESRVRNNHKNSIHTGNASWAFPSFSQLIESPELMLVSVASSNSSIIRAVNTSPVSSFNGNTNNDLPLLPRKSFVLGRNMVLDSFE